MDSNNDLEQDFVSFPVLVERQTVAETYGERRGPGNLTQIERHSINKDVNNDECDLITLDNTSNIETEYDISLSYQDDEGDTLLHSAIIVGSTELSLRLIEIMCPMQLNIKNKMQQSAIHLAAHVGDANLLRSLVEHGADLTATDNKGRTVFHIICASNRPKNLKVFSNYLDQEISQSGQNCSAYHKLRESLNLKDNEGQTCFHVACRDTTHTRNVEMVKALISLGVDINLTESKSGKTGLHIASEIGRSDVVRFLTERQEVDIEKTTYDGQTALITAYHRRQSNVVGILRNVGAVFSKRDIQKFGPFRE